MEGNAQKRTESGENTQCWKIILRSTDIRNVQRAMLSHPAKPWFIKTHLESAIGYGYRTKMSSRNHTFLFPESQRHIINPTNPRGTLDDRVEDRLHVGRRAADDTQYFGRRRLMFQRPPKFQMALLVFFEKPDIFNRDPRLISKGLEKCNLLVRKRSALDSTNKNPPDGTPLP